MVRQFELMMASANSSKLVLPKSVQVKYIRVVTGQNVGVDLGGSHELPMIGTTEFYTT